MIKYVKSQCKKTVADGALSRLEHFPLVVVLLVERNPNMDSIDTEKQQKFRTEKVAPEGGWGYLIPFGIAIPAVCK